MEEDHRQPLDSFFTKRGGKKKFRRAAFGLEEEEEEDKEGASALGRTEARRSAPARPPAADAEDVRSKGKATLRQA